MQPNKPDRPNRPNEQDRLADFFSILLGRLCSVHQGVHGGIAATVKAGTGCVRLFSTSGPISPTSVQLSSAARMRRFSRLENIAQDSRARLAGRAGRGGNPICPRRAFLACLALHVSRLVALAEWWAPLGALRAPSAGSEQLQRHSQDCCVPPAPCPNPWSRSGCRV